MTLAAILLFVCGILLVIAEIFLPGGILGVFGVIAVVAGIILGCVTYPEYQFFIISGSSLLAVISVVAGLYIIARTGVSRGLILEDSQGAEEGWVSNVSDETILNKSGTVFATLRPAGIIIVNDKRYDAVSDGAFIDKDEEVRVVEVKGNRVVVEKASDGEENG